MGQKDDNRSAGRDASFDKLYSEKIAKTEADEQRRAADDARRLEEKHGLKRKQ